jgi:hypothetical protein
MERKSNFRPKNLKQPSLSKERKKKAFKVFTKEELALLNITKSILHKETLC